MFRATLLCILLFCSSCLCKDKEYDDMLLFPFCVKWLAENPSELTIAVDCFVTSSGLDPSENGAPLKAARLYNNLQYWPIASLLYGWYVSVTTNLEPDHLSSLFTTEELTPAGDRQGTYFLLPSILQGLSENPKDAHLYSHLAIYFDSLGRPVCSMKAYLLSHLLAPAPFSPLVAFQDSFSMSLISSETSVLKYQEIEGYLSPYLRKSMQPPEQKFRGEDDAAVDYGLSLYTRKFEDQSRRIFDLILKYGSPATRAQAYTSLGLAEVGLHRNYATGVEYFRKALEFVDSSVTWRNYCGLLQLNRQNEEAVECWIKLTTEIDSSDATLFKDLGSAYMNLGKPGKSMEALQHAIEVDPQCPSCHYVYGHAFTHTGYSRVAWKEYEAFFKIAVRDWIETTPPSCSQEGTPERQVHTGPLMWNIAHPSSAAPNPHVQVHRLPSSWFSPEDPVHANPVYGFEDGGIPILGGWPKTVDVAIVSPLRANSPEAPSSPQEVVATQLERDQLADTERLRVEVPSSMRFRDPPFYMLHAKELHHRVGGCALYTECEAFFHHKSYLSAAECLTNPHEEDSYLEGVHMVAYVYGNDNYYHWLVEALPNVVLLAEYAEGVKHAWCTGEGEDQVCRKPSIVVLTTVIPQFVRELLRIVVAKYDHHIQVLESATDSVKYKFEEGYFVDWGYSTADFLLEDGTAIDTSPVEQSAGMHLDPAALFYTPRVALRLLHNCMVGEDLPPQDRDLLIYVPRGTSLRGMEDEEGVRLALQRVADRMGLHLHVHGESARGSVGGVQAQIDAFKQARVVVGAHGAGLANIVFCGVGTHVIEFPLLPLKQHYYLNAAYALDLQYKLFLHIYALHNGKFVMSDGATALLEESLVALLRQ
eukprot:Rmarinus@m.21012